MCQNTAAGVESHVIRRKMGVGGKRSGRLKSKDVPNTVFFFFSRISYCPFFKCIRTNTDLNITVVPRVSGTAHVGRLEGT